MNESGTGRPLGRSGISMPALGVGTNRWNASGPDQARLRHTLTAALDTRMGFFDTAEAYNADRSEIALGEAARTDGGLDDPDPGRGDVAGQARAVAAGPLDADQGDGPEPAQPAEQAGLSARADRELLDAEQAPDGLQRGGDVHVCVGVYAASDSASLFDGHSHPFLG
jgi:Aldo/keto reductase family